MSIPTDATWTPGFYVARVEQSDGLQAATFFTIRDDGAKLPVLAVLPLTRHAAYNVAGARARRQEPVRVQLELVDAERIDRRAHSR